MKNRLFSIAAAIALTSSCGGGEPSAPHAGPLAEHVERVSADQGVPSDLVLAIAVVEQGLRLPRWRTPQNDDLVPVAGILELRHGRRNTLAEGAALVGSDELTLQADTELGTEAGIRVLGSLAPARPASLADWSDALAELSGLGTDAQRRRYVADVYRVLRFGGSYPARDGERVVIAAHPELPASLLIAPPPLHPAVSEFPGSEYFPTDCTNKCTDYRPDGASSVDTIVIHDTEGNWDASVATLQFDPDKSVHYIIDADGSRWGQFVPESYTAWHAGNWCYNKHSVGIEHVGVASDPNGYATPMYAKSVEMVLNIMTRWSSMKVDRQHVIGHYQIPNGNLIAECGAPCSAGLDACESDSNYGGAAHHTDPGYYWQWCQYMEMMGGSCACNDAWSLWNCTTDKTEAWRCNDGTLEKQDCTGGCEVQAVGTPDVCHVSEPDAGTGGSSAGAGGSSGASGSAGDGWAAATGSAGNAGNTGKPAAGSEDDDGCGCRTPHSEPQPDAWLAAFAASCALAYARRRAR